jgi:hypothetical protein
MLLLIIGRNDWTRNGVETPQRLDVEKIKEHSGEGAIDWNESDYE